MDTIMTKPEDAEAFVSETGVHFLAPLFGNIHGGYPAGGADQAWDLPRYVPLPHCGDIGIPQLCVKPEC